MGSPGGPTQKKNNYEEPGRAHPKKNKKIFLVVVAHFLRCANTTDFVDRQNS